MSTLESPAARSIAVMSEAALRAGPGKNAKETTDLTIIANLVKQAQTDYKTRVTNGQDRPEVADHISNFIQLYRLIESHGDSDSIFTRYPVKEIYPGLRPSAEVAKLLGTKISANLLASTLVARACEQCLMNKLDGLRQTQDLITTAFPTFEECNFRVNDLKLDGNRAMALQVMLFGDSPTYGTLRGYGELLAQVAKEAEHDELVKLAKEATT